MKRKFKRIVIGYALFNAIILLVSNNLIIELLSTIVLVILYFYGKGGLHGRKKFTNRSK
ncbi:hypothetical protein [Clostridium ihumii]|uniref:hypothetical protein n=1 Tax=Clostridium ihumii TaxID=1470356 RepID=UPI003D3435FF